MPPSTSPARVTLPFGRSRTTSYLRELLRLAVRFVADFLAADLVLDFDFDFVAFFAMLPS